MRPAIASLSVGEVERREKAVVAQSSASEQARDAYLVVPHPRKPFVPISKHLQEKEVKHLRLLRQRKRGAGDAGWDTVAEDDVNNQANTQRPSKKLKVAVNPAQHMSGRIEQQST